MLTLREPDRSSAIAPYRQVAADLIERIRRGEWQPGDRLPSLEDVMHAAGIARLTARKAYRIVREAGYAELAPGMGHYVPVRLPGKQ
jgi:GntR family transcriptional regulator